VEFRQSPNYTKGRGGKKPSMIVIHAIAGSATSAENWFMNTHAKVSAHYIIDQTGKIVQMVKDEDTAWHCYGFNQTSIGLEHEDFGKCLKDPNWASETLLEASAKLVASLMKKWNIPLEKVKGHNDPEIVGYAKRLKPGMAHADPGLFPWDLYRKLITKHLGDK
jgi:N-acetyl-anhydromuramyl-L-alanine amidase AmpD